LEWLVGSYFYCIFAFNFLKVKYDILFGRFICDFTPALRHEKKGGTPPFFTFNFFGFLLSINSLA
jgi:hypothetical protein